MNFSFAVSALVFALAGSALLGQDTQTVVLNHKLQIPGAVLKPGEYTFAVEDRLQDRAIIRITNTKKNSHDLLLAVPSEKLNQSEHGKLILFSAANSDKQILQGWMCPSCQTALEVVYPKSDAVKITGETAKAVMAVDPTYDKLPKNLSPDDMKVVTLWLLSPKEVTPEQKGKGVEAAKYADLRNKSNTQVASAEQPSETKAVAASGETRETAPPPAGAGATANNSAVSSPVDSSAANSPASSPAAGDLSSPATTTAVPAKKLDSAPQADQSVRDYAAPAPAIATANTKPAAAKSLNSLTEMASTRHMPRTASNTYTLGLIGFMLLSAGAGSYAQRRFYSKLVRAKE